MAMPAIEVEGLSKLYHLGTIGRTSILDAFERWRRQRLGKEVLGKIGAKQPGLAPDDPQAGPEPDTFWALKDISFSVVQGEVLGVIGGNGAGKSTLFKILSKITEPTAGRAVLRGRAASLLEVGTGFHPDLTGRENIYLNGAILGMRQREIEGKFEEIVAFSEIKKFIDTSVKYYSSGMYLKLAFAVAAHLESHILLIDEVLAVGDMAFQKKCVEKMNDVASQGRTVLFISHNLEAIGSLTTRSLVFDKGRVVFDGGTSIALQRYQKLMSPKK